MFMRISKVYSINFFYFFSEYDHDFLNWYYNNLPEYLVHPRTLRKALVMTIDKKARHTVQFNEALYFAYYRIYRIKGKLTETRLKNTHKNIPVILRFALDDVEQVKEYLRILRLKTKFIKKFKKELKNKIKIDTFDLFVFFVENLTRKYKLRRVSKRWRIKGYKYSILKR